MAKRSSSSGVRPFGLLQLALEHEDVGLHVRQLLGEIRVLLGEDWVGGGELASDDEVEEPFEAALQGRLPSPELPQLLPTTSCCLLRMV